MFSANELASLFAITNARKSMLQREIAQSHVPNILNIIKNNLDLESIKERLTDACRTFKHPSDLNIGIYSYYENAVVDNLSVTVLMKDVINKTDFLYQLLDIFGHDFFRLTTSPIPTMKGYREIVLNYYPHKVPEKLKQSDPTMPPLSPISVVNLED
jgi:hypothetical protein